MSMLAGYARVYWGWEVQESPVELTHDVGIIELELA